MTNKKIKDAILAYEQNHKIYDYIYLNDELYINNSEERIYMFNGIDTNKLIKHSGPIKPNSVIYFEMNNGQEDYKRVIDFIRNFSNERHVLIADGGDGTVYPYEIPENILQVYCPNFRFNHPKYKIFPRGILKVTYKIYMDINIDKIYKTEKVYCNFNPGVSQERINDFKYWQTQTWVKKEHGISQDEYFINLFRHKFNICTVGIGAGVCHGYPADTYRIYESLLCGTFPIVRKHPLNIALHKDLNLPLLLVDDWEEVVERNLDLEFNRLSSICSLEAITESYWINRIRSHFN